MNPLENVDFSAAEAEVPVNNNFEAVGVAGLFGKNANGSSGLTWAYWGGTFLDNEGIADDDLTLTNAATNYIVVARSTGVVSVSTSTTNWDNTTGYARIYKVTTAGSVVTAEIDYRAGTGGVFASGGGSSSARDAVTAVTNSAGTVTLDYSLGDRFTHTMTANVTTLAFSNLPGSGKGATLMLRITQDSTPRTLAWPASFRWAGGAAPSISTGSGEIDVLAMTTFDNGTTWQSTLAQDFS